eukprot:5116180-Pleurochrysis_carterae.AAC.2
MYTDGAAAPEQREVSPLKEPLAKGNFASDCDFAADRSSRQKRASLRGEKSAWASISSTRLSVLAKALAETPNIVHSASLSFDLGDNKQPVHSNRLEFKRRCMNRIATHRRERAGMDTKHSLRLRLYRRTIMARRLSSSMNVAKLQQNC